jgi:hypothetical protein
MIKPDDFYSRGDTPGEKQKEAMWAAIKRHTTAPSSVTSFVWDRRSFAFGMAASLILGLALYGGWSILREALEASRPQPLRLERAYVSAIREFEQILPTSGGDQSQSTRAVGQLTKRKEQLELVDRAITDLRLQTNGTDLSPLKRDKLRQLYGMKLQILQQMIEEGEIEI